MRGAYCLVMKLDKDKDIQIGKLGRFHFPSGYYVYVGSAMNDLDARISRHLRPSSEKKMHWHIDYFLEHAKVIDIIRIPSEVNIEKEVAQFFAEYGKVIAPGFGSSDTGLETHLFYFERRPRLEVVKE